MTKKATPRKRVRARSLRKAEPKPRGIRVSLKTRCQRIDELADELEADASSVWRVRGTDERQALLRLKEAVEKVLTPLTKEENMNLLLALLPVLELGKKHPIQRYFEEEFRPLAALIYRKVRQLLRDETKAVRAANEPYRLPPKGVKTMAWERLEPQIRRIAIDALVGYFAADERTSREDALSTARSVAEMLSTIDFRKEPSGLAIRRAIGLMSAKTHQRERARARG
jgi:hypothetical protein